MAMNGPSYRFRLERVRALRERREEQAKQEFGVALQARERCQEEVNGVAVRIDAACRDQLVATADDLGAHQSYLERLERAHEVALEELARDCSTDLRCHQAFPDVLGDAKKMLEEVLGALRG